MDHSLELFFRQAEHRRWFRNTIFVIWGDHGVSRGSTDTRFGDLGLAVHHVPLLLYSPALLKPRRAPVIASSMDILPTVVAMLGLENRTQTLGKDLFDPRYGDLAAAFTFTTFRRPPRIGVLQGDYYVNVDPNGSVALFRTDETDPRDRSAQEPERAASMARLARAFHESSKYLLAPAVGALAAGKRAGAVVTPVLLPWLPGRAFSVKGGLAGGFLAACAVM